MSQLCGNVKETVTVALLQELKSLAERLSNIQNRAYNIKARLFGNEPEGVCAEKDSSANGTLDEIATVTKDISVRLNALEEIIIKLDTL